MKDAAQLSWELRNPRWCWDERRPCQSWRCRARACWNVWAGFKCYDHAIRGGWLPGPARPTGVLF